MYVGLKALDRFYWTFHFTSEALRECRCTCMTVPYFLIVSPVLKAWHKPHSAVRKSTWQPFSFFLTFPFSLFAFHLFLETCSLRNHCPPRVFPSHSLPHALLVDSVPVTLGTWCTLLNIDTFAFSLRVCVTVWAFAICGQAANFLTHSIDRYLVNGCPQGIKFTGILKHESEQKEFESFCRWFAQQTDSLY